MLKKLVFLFSIGRVRHGRCYFATLTIELSCVFPNMQMHTWWVRGGTDPWKCKRMVFRWACGGSPPGQWLQGGICQAGTLPTAPWREWQSRPQSVLSVSTNGSGKVGAGLWDLKGRSLELLCTPSTCRTRLSLTPPRHLHAWPWPGSLLTPTLCRGSVHHSNCSFFFLRTCMPAQHAWRRSAF